MRHFAAYFLIPLLCLYFCIRIQEHADHRRNVVLSLQSVEAVFVTLLNAETGQRGYLLTNKETYLEPYVFAEQTVVPTLVEAKKTCLPEDEETIAKIEALSSLKMAELRQSIDACRLGGTKPALALVNQGDGLKTMNEIRVLVEELQLKNHEQWKTGGRSLNEMIYAAKTCMLLVLFLSTLNFSPFIWAYVRGGTQEKTSEPKS
jgi:CHASE3 domain sensor protein